MDLSEINGKMDEYNRGLVSQFDGTREEFILRSIDVFALIMEEKSIIKDTAGFFNDLENGVHALDVLLEWSGYIEKRSERLRDIPRVIDGDTQLYFRFAYDNAEDYSIVKEALESRFTDVTVDSDAVRMTSKNKTDYLRELVSRAIAKTKGEEEFEPYLAEWNALAGEVIGEAARQAARVEQTNAEALLDVYLRGNQLSVDDRRMKRIYDFHLRKNLELCSVDLTEAIDGFEISDYIKVISAVESISAVNYAKCYMIYRDELWSQMLHFRFGEYLGVRDSRARIDDMSYWSISATEEKLTRALKKLTHLSDDTVGRVVEFLTYRQGEHILESPLLRICDRLVITPFLMPNFRMVGLLPNKLSTRYSERYILMQKRASDRQIGELVDRFAAAGFITEREISIYENGNPLTDVDLLVYSSEENRALLIEHKSCLVPYVEKLHYIDKHLRKAEKQLERARGYIEEHRGEFFGRLGIPADARIDTCILMANNLGSSNSGVSEPIINTGEMNKLIAASRGRLGYIIDRLRDEKYMKDIDISAYYVGEESYKYAGYTFIFDALKYK